MQDSDNTIWLFYISQIETKQQEREDYTEEDLMNDAKDVYIKMVSRNQAREDQPEVTALAA